MVKMLLFNKRKYMPDEMVSPNIGYNGLRSGCFPPFKELINCTFQLHAIRC